MRPVVAIQGFGVPTECVDSCTEIVMDSGSTGLELV